MMISSEDGIHFDNIRDKKTVIPVLRDPAIGDARHTRDPKVWKEEDAWYMVLGSTIEDQKGRLLFFRSRDREHWTYVNEVSAENGLGWMWECPDYFTVDGHQILIFSPMGLLKDGRADENQTICMQVSFDKESCRMELSDSYQFLDYGMDLYAPQSTVDAEGRRILTAWLRMPEPVNGEWQGMMCIPRVVKVNDGTIWFDVHPNIRAAYTKKIASPEEAKDGEYRLRFTLEDGEAVISNTVYCLGEEIVTEGNVKLELETLGGY